jgi:hypothetical protein
MKQKRLWLIGGSGSVALGLVLLAAPARWEGPVLVPLSPGHALSVLDSVALVPVLFGMGWLYLGLWQRRERLYASLQRSPQAGALAVFVAGLGLGLLVASGLSAFFWWWAIGGLLFALMLIVTLKVAA